MCEELKTSTVRTDCFVCLMARSPGQTVCDVCGGVGYIEQFFPPLPDPLRHAVRQANQLLDVIDDLLAPASEVSQAIAEARVYVDAARAKLAVAKTR